jgi:hypothetical protein
MVAPSLLVRVCVSYGNQRTVHCGTIPPQQTDHSIQHAFVEPLSYYWVLWAFKDPFVVHRGVLGGFEGALG